MDNYKINNSSDINNISNTSNILINNSDNNINETNILINVKNLNKIYNKPRFSLTEGLFAYTKNKPKPKFALKDITFKINKGESIGIIGENGSGKSTLLKILSGVTSQTSGKVNVTGKISSLLELGCGFNPEYTGISNIYLNGEINGLKKSEIKEKLSFIKDFANIGDFIYNPVKTYSDGMFLRLAFACAVATEPDILIIDEAMAVGDFSFRQKCFNQISHMKKSGTTLILVSHDIDTIRCFCDRTIWLSNGEIKMDADTFSVSAAYMEYITGKSKNILTFNNDQKANTLNRFGSAPGSISEVSVAQLQTTGEEYDITVKINIPKLKSYDDTAVSVSVKNGFGLDLIVFSTADNNIDFTSFGKYKISFKYKCCLCPGRYSVSVSLEDRSSTPITYYDYIHNATEIEVTSPKTYFGTFHSDCDIEIKENLYE